MFWSCRLKTCDLIWTFFHRLGWTRFEGWLGLYPKDWKTALDVFYPQKQTGGASTKVEAFSATTSSLSHVTFPLKPRTSLRKSVSKYEREDSDRQYFSKSDAFRKLSQEVLTLCTKYFFWLKAVMGAERSKGSIRCGWLHILSCSLPSFPPLCRLCGTLTLKVFDVPCLSPNTLWAAPLVSTSMFAKQSVALEQLAFEIQCEPPGRELLRNSDSLCTFVAGLDVTHNHTWLDVLTWVVHDGAFVWRAENGKNMMSVLVLSLFLQMYAPVRYCICLWAT